jgi:hypothetical protein
MNMRPIVLSLIILFAIASCSGQNSGSKQDVSLPSGPDSLVITLVGQDSVSVFDLLKKEHSVKSWGTAMGTYVAGIDSLENSSSVFWIYSVNDTMPQTASDKWLTHTGDKVQWHFRKLAPNGGSNNR